MSAELKKFMERWNKATKGKDLITHYEAEGARERCRQAMVTAQTGYQQLNDDVLAAIESGVTGTTIEEFAKHGAVKSTLAGIKSMMADQLNHANDFIDMGKQAAAMLPVLESLSADIAKDLAGRKEKSKSKADIEKLQKEVDDRIADLKKLQKITPLKPAHMDPTLDYKAEIADILKRSKEELKSEKNSALLPQMLEAKNLQRNTIKAQGVVKAVVKACDEAITAAQAGDKAKALGGVKEARDAMAELTEMAETYDGILKKYKQDIDVSKDKAGILAAIDKIDKSQKACDAKMKTAVAAVRSATWAA